MCKALTHKHGTSSFVKPFSLSGATYEKKKEKERILMENKEINFIIFVTMKIDPETLLGKTNKQTNK